MSKLPPPTQTYGACHLEALAQHSTDLSTPKIRKNQDAEVLVRQPAALGCKQNPHINAPLTRNLYVSVGIHIHDTHIDIYIYVRTNMCVGIYLYMRVCVCMCYMISVLRVHTYTYRCKGA